MEDSKSQADEITCLLCGEKLSPVADVERALSCHADCIQLIRKHATDAQAAQGILDANPGMLWQYAIHRNGRRFGVRYNGTGYEVLLRWVNGVVVTVWENIQFMKAFTLHGHMDPALSISLDQALLKGMVSGRLQSVAMEAFS